MSSKDNQAILEKQGYRFIGRTSAIKICTWTRNSLIDKGECYKEKFYGINSHRCCQMSPNLSCENQCMHCWRAIELDIETNSNKSVADKPEKIIDDCIKAQRKLLTGFKGNKKANMKKFLEAQNPSQFAISLSGEPTLYPYLPELIKELRKRKISTFLVSNGLHPEVLKKLNKEKALPTQLYISLNTPNKEMYKKWHKSSMKNAWEKFNESLKIIKKLDGKTRRVLRMTLVRNKNMAEEENYAKLILVAMPDFVEVKGFMSVGFARKRLGYETMPTHEEIRNFSEKLERELKDGKYEILDEKTESRVVLLGRDRRKMKIKKSEI